jgi:hypothetical protein
MRTLLILVAVLGLPLNALAQPVVGDGKSTQATQPVGDARDAAEVSGLTVTGQAAGSCPPGNPHPPHVNRKLLDAPSDTKNKRTEESTGTRTFIVTLAGGNGNNTTDYSMPGLNVPRLKSVLACSGVFKGIKFLHVSQSGWDDFEVDFSNGALEWAIAPFNAHHVTNGSALLFIYPQPATNQLENWLKSMEQGRPNYADLAPDLASKLQARWPALQTSLKDWGPLKGFRFVRQEDDGAYVFLATYEHRQVVWTASLPNADGKFTALTYDEKAG